MIKKVKGLVIKEIAYKDTSKIIEVLTKDGIVSMIAFGSKKVSSPLFSGTTFLSYSEFCIYEKKSILTLKSVSTINSFKNILKNITEIAAATYLVNLATQVYKQNNNSNIYELLLTSLGKLESGLDVLGIVNIIEIKMLKYLGLKLHLDNCAVCGSSDINYLSLDYSGYLCRKHSKISVDRKILKLIKVYDTVDINKLDRFNVSRNIVLIVDKFIDEYYEKYTGLYLDSKKFFKMLLE